jgi:hypothetical protein
MRHVLLWITAALLVLSTGAAHAQNMTPGADPGGPTTAGTGAVRYVSQSDGSDSDDGLTTATAWQTITKVNSMNQGLGVGATILFKRGDTWTGSTLSIDHSGNSSNPLVYGAYGSTGARPIIRGDNVNDIIDGRSWIIVDRLHFDDGETIRISDSNNIIVQYSEISKRDQACIKAYHNSFNVTVQYNKIHDCGGYVACTNEPCNTTNGEGIYFGSAVSNPPIDNSHDLTARGNDIYNTTHDGVDIKQNMDDILVEENIFHDSTKNTTNPGMLAAIIINESSTGNPATTNIILQRNVIYNWEAQAMIMTGGSSLRVVNNLIYDVRVGHGIRVRGGGDFFHNTIYNVQQAGKNPIQFDSDATGYDVRHNLGPSTTNNLAANANMFVNPAGGNFKLKAGSTAIDLAAVYGSVTTDILQITRPKGATVDYGAYEYTAGTETPLHLVFTAPPVTTPEDTAMPTVEVCAKDPTEVTDPSFVAAISLAITTNPAAGTLTGGTGGAATAGCRQFPGLSIDNDGVCYKVTAAATGATSIESPCFNVTDIVIPPPVSAPQALKIPIVQ